MLTATSITSAAKMSQSIWGVFGPWLQKQRELAEVSQSDLGKKIDVSVVQLSRIENGHSGVKRSTLLEIVEGINLLSTGHKVDAERALNMAGFAPVSPSPRKPETVAEFLEAMEQLGIGHFEFLEDERLRNATPDDFQHMLDTVQQILNIEVNRIRYVPPRHESENDRTNG
jgi:transcriptional regulator with XRE-family HTH domain